MTTKPFNPKDLPQDLRAQVTEEWVLGELQAKGLLDEEKADARSRPARADAFEHLMAGLLLAALAGFSMHYLIKAPAALAASFALLAAVIFGAAAFMRGTPPPERGRKAWLYNFGATAKGRIAQVHVVYDSRINTKGVRCHYSFVDAQGNTHHCVEMLEPAAVRPLLVAGQEAPVLYHPAHPAMLHTLRVPAAAALYGWRNDAG
ncbi:MAG: hypothetical protein ACAH80_16285 [Alphaproteobacteria bacterium]